MEVGMGKVGKNQSESAFPPASTAEDDAGDGCTRLRRIVRLRCVAALVLGVAMLLSVIFWLPPFLRHYGGHKGHSGDLTFAGENERICFTNFGIRLLDIRYDPASYMYVLKDNLVVDLILPADIIASFKLQKSLSMLNTNLPRLQLDIFEEIGVPNSWVSIISLEPISDTNWTTVVFGVLPYPSTAMISSTALSILRSSFMSLVVRQSTFHLTTSLFGNSSSFEVLKFPKGITIIPPQNIFLLQKVHTFFTFKLNFPINQVEDKIGELRDQMKVGLLLTSNENLYIKLTNLEGSTVAPPTRVQISIMLAVGNHQPSLRRLKQLAKNIRDSSEGNLGLNHTVFGKVKQVRLSSFIRYSLTKRGSEIPSPAPQPNVNHIHRFHHHWQHHVHHHHTDVPPVLAPSHNNHESQASSSFQYGFPSKSKTRDHLTPASLPLAPQTKSAAHEAASKHVSAHAGAPASSALPSSAQLLAPHGNQDPLLPSPCVLPVSPSPAVPFHNAPTGRGGENTDSCDQALSTLLDTSAASTSYSPTWVLALLIALVSL
ncbi:hypothetical protein ZIOFF_005190 [Zingiber officinale]|uniref:DUF7036 domain-containing protein n=1 Tax=Zingiber officinale TaxID=94328 RepID=A0A8J5HV54_ZINOF|nr:hypothetical protein ZIOFF_005190 [Zingiber officinale]